MVSDAMACGDRTEVGVTKSHLKDTTPEDPEMTLPPEEPPGSPTKKAWTWQLSVVFLCFYGFMVQLKPGEPFITPNLLSTEKNFTREQVTNEINPVLSYSYMAVLVPVFLLTDFLRYKPVLILSSLSHVSIWLLLLLGSSLLEMQFMEFFYGITMAARVAYSSYIFSLVAPEMYQRVASYSRSSVLMGVFSSSVLGQLLISVGRLSFSTLSAISLGFVSFGLLLSTCLPWPKRSLFFNRAARAAQRNLLEQAAAQSERDRMKQDEGGTGDTPALAPLGSGSSWRDSVFVQMLKELRNMPRRPSLRLWSLWGHHVVCGRLCEDPLERVVRAGDRRGHGPAGRPAAPHGEHYQHLGLLRVLHPLQRLLPVPGTHRHFPDRVVPHQGAVCPGVWGQHVPVHHSENHHHPHHL